MGDGIPQTQTTPWPPKAERRPRVWPGVVIALLYWAALKVPAWIMPGTMTSFQIAGMSAMALFVLFVLWWLFFSRLRWAERFAGLLAFAAVGAGMWFAFEPSVQGQQAQDTAVVLQFYVLPVVLTGWALWALVARSFGPSVRLAGLVVVLLMTWGYFATLRLDGVTGTYSPEFSYRWQSTAAERHRAARAAEKLNAESIADAATAPPLELGPADWPGFRGPARDGRRTDVRIATDWKQHPPKQVWRHLIGPGWSSFAVVGSRLFTQEQLGDVERVVSYDASTGKEVWAHTDKTRFADAQSGEGPRATPTFHEGRIYALGATGKLNCLDAATGKLVWSKDIAKDSGAKVPMWGFSSSPLVVQGIVTVFAGAGEGKSVLAYHADSGKPAWTAGNGTGSYCSVHPARIAGVEQLVVATQEGMSSFDPANGNVLWEYEWLLGEHYNRITQPALVGDSDVLLGSGFDNGTRRVHISRKGSEWNAKRVWESRAISPYFNDLVVHKGHLYGFHSLFLTCVNLETGKSTWKERGYTNGQALLLPDQDLLLVLTETGEVALVEAKPGARTELGRFPAFSGKTWNHPVMANGKLFVRNGEEVACYELAADGAAVAAR
jgi:outer membrane protein assembly factor BamB